MDTINIINLYKLSQNKKELISQLQLWELIPNEGTYKCPQCGGVLKLSVDNERTDGYRWMCYNKINKRKQKRANCSNRINLRIGTFFERSNLSIFQILAFAHLWVDNFNMSVITRQIEISYKTAVEWGSICREVILNWMTIRSEKLGGEGTAVEINEAKFGKRKHHRDRSVEGQRIFGGYERGSGKVFMILVEDRGIDTLLPVIQEWILPGTNVVSEYWKAHDCLNTESYAHLKVNRSMNFSDPETGAHANAVESSWRAAKTMVSAGGRMKSGTPGNLAVYMFHKRCAERSLVREVEFFRMAGGLYNPTKENPPALDDDLTDDEL